MFHRIALLIVCASMAVGAIGCPKQGSTDSGEAAEATPAPTSRFSGATATFVDALLATSIVGYDVAREGASVIYQSMGLEKDGTFSADATLRLGDGEDAYPCVESGTWTLDDDKAESATVAMVTFDMKSTDCPGRTAPKSWRAKLEISGSDVLVSQF